MTFCELQREINSARLDHFIPRCVGDGEFEVVQCHSISGECWCVDEAGVEILGTKTLGTPKCDESQGRHKFLIVMFTSLGHVTLTVVEVCLVFGSFYLDPLTSGVSRNGLTVKTKYLYLNVIGASL